MSRSGRRRRLAALAAAWLSLNAAVAGAQPPRDADEPGFTSLASAYYWFGLHSGATWLDQSLARREGMGDVGPNFYVSFGVGMYDLVTLSLSWGAAFPKDHADLEQGSHLQVTSYSGEIGLRSPGLCTGLVSEGSCMVLHAFTNLGRSSLAAQRYADDCNDCSPLTDVDFGSASFIEPGLAFGVPSYRPFGVDLRASFRKYLVEAAVESELRVGVAMMFF
jgi:hypothetical protein